MNFGQDFVNYQTDDGFRKSNIINKFIRSVGRLSFLNIFLKNCLYLLLMFRVIVSAVGGVNLNPGVRTRNSFSASSNIFANNNLTQNTRPKVSVIIPVYKVEKWLGDCLDSLVNQTMNPKDLEIICVNDGSPDRSAEILNIYSKRNTNIKIINQANQGVQTARNTGLACATGEYIALVDSDDFVSPETYEACYNLAKKNNDDIIEFGYISFDDGYPSNVSFDPDDHGRIFDQKGYLNKCTSGWVYCWNKLYKSDIIKKDDIKFIKGIKPNDDTTFALMCVGNAKSIRVIQNKFYHYRMRRDSICYNMDYNKIYAESFPMIKCVCDFYRKLDIFSDKYVKAALLNKLLTWSTHYEEIFNNHKKEILNSFGDDILNAETKKLLPMQKQNIIKS
ncbi:MAG: glycosyltransferase [Candidatus Improbicoccus devescovinae]|nr:MAG: glycosyltransferase [Candidatus Improbicoccus devescovinae]